MMAIIVKILSPYFYGINGWFSLIVVNLFFVALSFCSWILLFIAGCGLFTALSYIKTMKEHLSQTTDVKGLIVESY